MQPFFISAPCKHSVSSRSKTSSGQIPPLPVIDYETPVVIFDAAYRGVSKSIEGAKMKPQLLTTAKACVYLGGESHPYAVNTMEGQRVRGEGAPYIKIGRLVRYRVSDLDAYLEAQTRRSTSQA
jgi:hypothetical protein